MSSEPSDTYIFSFSQRSEDVDEVESGPDEDEVLDKATFLKLKPDVTGLPMCIWISRQYPGRIFVSKRYGDDAEAGDWFVMDWEDLMSYSSGSSDGSDED